MTDDLALKLTRAINKQGDLKQACALIVAGAPTTHLGTLLTQALRVARWEDQVSVLVAAGGDIHGRAADGTTALHCAQTINIARSLVAHGANPLAVDDHGNTALHTAVRDNDGNKLRALTDLGVPDTTNNAGQRYTDLYVGTFRANDVSSPITTALLKGYLGDTLRWEVEVWAIDLPMPLAEDEDTPWLENARVYIDNIASWQGRHLDSWTDLLSMPIHWQEPLAPEAESSCIYVWSHERLASSQLSFGDSTRTTCALHWNGTTVGGGPIHSFELECELRFAGVSIQTAATAQDANAQLRSYFSNGTWWIDTKGNDRWFARPADD